jgi:hypothetical protein
MNRPADESPARSRASTLIGEIREIGDAFAARREGRSVKKSALCKRASTEPAQPSS